MTGFWRAPVLLAALALYAAGQDAASQVRAEIERIRRTLRETRVAETGAKEVNSMVEGSLNAAADALNARRLYLSLEQLGQAVDLLRGVQAAANDAEVVEGGLPAFQVEYRKASAAVAGIGRDIRAGTADRMPAALLALSESARVKAMPLLEGGRGFATSTHPKDGLFYLGEALGEAEFARFCMSLKAGRRQSPIRARSLARELQSLQVKTNAAFVPPRSIEMHPRFIALNSTLKLARDLDAAHYYFGALYEYLEAVRHYGVLNARSPTDAEQAELKKAMSAERNRIAASKQDDSLAEIFLQRAESQVAHANQDEWKSAQVILTQVLPEYYGVLGAAPAPPIAPVKAVQITLVRWPYT